MTKYLNIRKIRIILKMETKPHIVKSELSKILAVLLIEQGSYTYVDKIAQTVSKDLALYHIREALRDYNSLLTREFTNKEARAIADSIRFQEVEKEIETISKISSISDLREIVSLISSQALAEAARIKSRSIYNIALEIKEYLKQRGLSFTKAEDLKILIQNNISNISRDLNIDEEIINNVSENQTLLEHIVKKERKEEDE